ncbi:hypothetical protein AB9M92_01925 [Peribacillus frigoritolerans]|uniref:Uncharacterized protein n=1 Tax=Peribacillus simplex TaxID=1478 RepID=A0A9W4PI10_9BACI|nr:hypothetical protein [Peribacillus simplex]CAH0289600.1 hypothetical protein SRABI133_04192 [Peribacillus simplex]
MHKWARFDDVLRTVFNDNFGEVGEKEVMSIGENSDEVKWDILLDMDYVKERLHLAKNKN